MCTTTHPTLIYRSLPISTTPTRYEAATREQVPLFSDPYLFEDFETIGTTYSAPFFNSDGDLAGVIGIDITLDLITEQLRSFTSPGDVIFGECLSLCLYLLPLLPFLPLFAAFIHAP